MSELVLSLNKYEYTDNVPLLQTQIYQPLLDI